MISLRYHLVTIAAVLLALALGVVLGASSFSGRMLATLTSDRQAAGMRADALDADRAATQARLDATEGVVAAGAPAMVRGQLAGRTVAVVTAPGADDADVAAVTDLVDAAGARVSGRLGLTDAALAPERADALRGLVTRVLPAGVALPATPDSATLLGSLLGATITTRPGDLTVRGTPGEAVTALTALAGGGFTTPVAPVAPTPAQLVVVITGTAAAPDRASSLARLAGALDREGGGALLAARGADGAVAAVRADPALRSAMSTVDSLDRPSGRVAAVLGLREQADGHAGAYGSGSGTTAPAPVGAPLLR